MIKDMEEEFHEGTNTFITNIALVTFQYEEGYLF